MSKQKIIYIVRHAQGEHNVTKKQPQGNSQVKDPILTPLGREQSRVLRSIFPHQDDIQIVMASGLRRTIQTAVTAFAPALTRPEVPILLVPMAQEISAKPCDIGTDAKELEAGMSEVLKNVDVKFDVGKIDYTLLHDGWNSKEGIYEASLEAVTKRAAALRKWLYHRPESTIVLVTHGAFIHYLTEDWAGLRPPRGTAYLTTEFRAFTFDETSTESNPHLVQIGGGAPNPKRPIGAHEDDITGIGAADVLEASERGYEIDISVLRTNTTA